MNEPFGKFYFKTFTGSMMGAGAHVIAVMAYAISAAKPPDGDVELNPKLLAVLIGEPEERMVDAIAYLESPDPRSRSQNDQGKRLIRKGSFLFTLVNWKTHRAGFDEETRKNYYRVKMQESRERARAKALSATGRPVKPAVKDCETMSSQLIQAEAEAEAKAVPPTPLPPDSAAVALGGGDGKSNILKDWKPTPEQLRLGALFGRRETTPWADKETKSLKVISPIPEEDLALIEKYYRIPPVDPQHDYHRRDLYSLLNNWTGELDRARLAVNAYANPRPVNGQPAPENVWALGKRRDAVDEEIAEVRRGLPDLYPEEREKLRKLRSIRQALTIQIAQSPA
jgi:hypothetical protein